MALSRIESSSGVNPPSIRRNNPTRFIMFDLRTSAGDSSSRGKGKSKGLMWCSEVKEILKFELSVSAKKIIGIPEIKEYIDWRITFNDCKELMKKNTRNYAKRQLTWFRADKRIKWVENADEVLSRVKV